MLYRAFKDLTFREDELDEQIKLPAPGSARIATEAELKKAWIAKYQKKELALCSGKGAELNLEKEGAKRKYDPPAYMDTRGYFSNFK